MVKEKMSPLYTPITVALHFKKVTTFKKNKLFKSLFLIYSDSFQLAIEMNSVNSHLGMC